jgi:hypothetical protein
MPGKSNARNWNDVETAIATAAIVTTLGLWNLFATPEKNVIVKAERPTDLPPTDFPAAAEEPVTMPQVKILFTPAASEATQIVSAHQQSQPQVKKKKKNNNNITQSIIQTRTS